MMVSRLKCPDCNAVLKTATPMPVGKKVKCPKCGTTFAAAADDDEAPTKAPPKKKPEPARPAPAKPAKPAADDDEDSITTYGVARDPDEEMEEAAPGKPAQPKKKKPEISQIPDESIKDLRGPAQAAVVGPTNTLLISGLLGFIGWLALLILLLIPECFPLETDDAGDKAKPKQALRIPRGLGAASNANAGAPETDKDKEKAKKDETSGRSFLYVMGFDLADLAGYDIFTFLIYISPILLCLVYSAFVAYGAVKVQNLESRTWGMVSSIMSMLPANIGGLIVVIAIVMERIMEMIFYDDPSTITQAQIGMAVLLCLGEIGAGVWCLLTVFREDVIEGFEYVPE